MRRINRYLAQLSGRQDIVLAMMLMLSIFMMILPLPTGLVDLFVTLNLTFSIILLMIAIYIREPLEFSSFPTVLLITTLYRLSLSISTTRLILLQHDAGEMVYLFGHFVVGGNLVVGLIIFSIITIVQFIVITKGAERVAEVGARFSLDGMPGKQMSIDGDMRAGIIDMREAKRQRALVQKESQFYGAMDGAMKFVKGDAIASIIVTLVNILGGIAVGIFQHDMTASEAVNTYSVLSVGDGLIAQIPALLISITAGIIVTRVPGEEPQNLAIDLAQQLGGKAQPLLVASSVLLLFALFPGFPTLLFLLLALLLGSIAYLLKRRVHSTAVNTTGTDQIELFEITPGAKPLLIQINKELNTPQLLSVLNRVRQQIFERLGLALPEIEVQVNVSAAGGVRILLYQELVCGVVLPQEKILIESQEAPPTVPHQRAQIPLGSRTLYWVDRMELTAAQKQEVTIYAEEERIAYCLTRTIYHHAKEFVGIQETRFLMDAMESQYSELIKELQRQMQVSRVAEILQRLVEEHISIRDLRTIFETLISWINKEKDLIMLTEYIRIALKRHIMGHYADEQRTMEVWLIGPTIENMVRESIRQTSSGSYSTLTQKQNRMILQQIQQQLAPREKGILLTALDVRRYLRKIIERQLFDIAVCSFQELDDEIELQVLGNIELLEDPSHAVAG